MPEQMTVRVEKLNLAKMHENQAVQVVIVRNAKTGEFVGMHFEPVRIQKFKANW
tara:strand:- start:2069 stop:2230 length:162 start_codon:yes stop_codon:yes gene_type:complete